MEFGYYNIEARSMGFAISQAWSGAIGCAPELAVSTPTSCLIFQPSVSSSINQDTSIH